MLEICNIKDLSVSVIVRWVLKTRASAACQSPSFGWFVVWIKLYPARAMHANVISEREQHIAVRRVGDINAVSNRSEHNTHIKRYGRNPATRKDHNDIKPIWKITVL